MIWSMVNNPAVLHTQLSTNILTALLNHPTHRFMLYVKLMCLRLGISIYVAPLSTMNQSGVDMPFNSIIHNMNYSPPTNLV